MDTNAVKEIINTGPRTSIPPLYWYFGTFADDEYELCAERCKQQVGCKAFALPMSDFGGVNWRNQCYGRGPQYTTMAPQPGVISGEKMCLQIYSKNKQVI